MAFRESTAEFGKDLYASVLKRLETVPLRLLPAAIYQCLLFFRGTDHLQDCFECLFAVMEAQNDKIQARECMAHIRLAISHDVGLSQALAKFCQRALHPLVEPSPYLLLIIIDVFQGSKEAISLLERYLGKIASNLDRAAALKETIAGLDPTKWPRPQRILARVIKTVEGDDDRSLGALCTLGLGLLASQNSLLRATGGDVLLSIYQVG